MEVIKRPRDRSDSEVDLPAAKIAKKVQELSINDAFELENEMNGVEAKDFIHITSEDYFDAINEIEIDDRFMKIPKQVTDSAAIREYFERPSLALIPYDDNKEKENQETDLSGHVPDQ